MECARCPRGCRETFRWHSPQMSGSLFVCWECAHKLNNAGEVVERKGRVMRRSPSVETIVIGYGLGIGAYGAYTG